MRTEQPLDDIRYLFPSLPARHASSLHPSLPHFSLFVSSASSAVFLCPRVLFGLRMARRIQSLFS